MKVLMLYNEFRSAFGGEDKVVSEMISIFQDHGVEVILETRSSKNLTFTKKTEAFFGGVYNPKSYSEIKKLLIAERPDVVHVHNLYPFFSPSVLAACRKAQVPVVMTLHNFALTCPHWSHFREGKVCEECTSGNTAWCVINNCQGNILESIGYAIRTDMARRFGWFRKNVSVFLALSEFAKKRLVSAGYPDDKIVVFPNPVELPENRAHMREGKYVAFAGRMSEEKGVDCLLAAARLLPNLEFGLAGDGPLFEKAQADASENVKFHGRLNAMELQSFYRNARLLVVPSTCFEMCPTVLLEGMALALPVVASKTGGLPEFVSHEETGLLFERGDPKDLAAKINQLWNDPDLSEALGEAARQWITQECNKTVYFNRLMGVYRGLVDSGSGIRRT